MCTMKMLVIINIDIGILSGLCLSYGKFSVCQGKVKSYDCDYLDDDDDDDDDDNIDDCGKQK